MPPCSEDHSIARILVETPLFGLAGVEGCARLASEASRRDYVPRDILFSGASGSDSVFIVLTGMIRLTRRTAGARDVVVGEEAAPCTLIPTSVFDGHPTAVTATSTSIATAYVVAGSVFRKFCESFPAVLFAALTEFSGRVRNTAEFIDLITIANIRQRVARVLLDLADENANTIFNLPCSQANLASSIGTVREVVFRHLKQLQSEGVLHFHGSEMAVDDMAALQRAAGTTVGSEHVFSRLATPMIPAYLAFRCDRNRRCHGGG